MLNIKQQKELLKIARASVEAYVSGGKAPDFKITGEALNKKQGAFVTLTKNGRLRGCIGQIAPSNQPLWQLIQEMAIAAASQDNRFNPVSRDELGELEYEISVLSAPEVIGDWRKIKLGEHGVIIRKSGRSGVFLPQVATETGWDLEKFLSELCLEKAGLAPDAYKDKNTEIKIFTAQVFK